MTAPNVPIVTLAQILARSTLSASGCWEWTGSRLPRGYGQVFQNNGTVYAHRLAWSIAHGQPVPDGMTVDHLCFNPPCANPDHLRLLTPGENSARQRSALSATCKRGHEFSLENTRLRPSGGGRWLTRSCRTCDAMHQQARNARRRAERAAARLDGVA